MDMLESLLGVGLKFNHLRPKRFGGGVSALLKISLLATRFFNLSPDGTTYPWRAQRTEPGRFEHVQAGLDREAMAKLPSLWWPTLNWTILSPETDIFGESCELSLVSTKRVFSIFSCQATNIKKKWKNCVFFLKNWLLGLEELLKPETYMKNVKVNFCF